MTYTELFPLLKEPSGRQLKRRREYLVQKGRACFWHPYRSGPEAACDAAGLR